MLDEHILSICDFYESDLNKNSLESKLSLLGTLFEDLKSSIDVPLIIIRLRKLTQPQKGLFSEVAFFDKLLLLAPAVNAVSEPSGSILKNIKM